MLKGKKILLAVSGSIAAYKTAFLIRLLVKEEAEVKVIMTDSAREFITPLTLATLSKNPVYSQFFKKDTGEWTSHVELGLWADLMVVAPASANTISKMAHGLCDNLLLATYLSARCHVMVAPAMDLDMYHHRGTQQNLETLAQNGNQVIEARSGELASGLIGDGRMAEPEELLEIVAGHFRKEGQLSEKKILITSGPTHEPIDAVRFIGNRSSGKMGKALALESARCGAKVTFISGPVVELPQHPDIEVIAVETADEMFKATKERFKDSDIGIFTAAVSDYRPETKQSEKIKRSGSSLDLKLVENPDIALEMGKLKNKDQITVGFALETSKDPNLPLQKLKKKNFDLIVLNSLDDKDAGFGHDTNKITIFDRDNKTNSFELKRKEEVAEDIIDALIETINAK